MKENKSVSGLVTRHSPFLCFMPFGNSQITLREIAPSRGLSGLCLARCPVRSCFASVTCSGSKNTALPFITLTSFS